MNVDKLEINGDEIVVIEMSLREAIAFRTMCWYHEDGQYDTYVNGPGNHIGATVFAVPLENAGVGMDLVQIKSKGIYN